VLIGCSGASETHIKMRIEVLPVGVRPMLEAAAHRAYWRFGRPGTPQAGRTNRVAPPRTNRVCRRARPRAIHRVPATFNRLEVERGELAWSGSW
jgi:hypothetical protein